MRVRYFSFLAVAALILLTGQSCISLGSTATGPMGMYRSSDKGETWQQIAALPTTTGVKSISGVKVFRIFTDPSDPGALYIGTRGQGLFYTYNNGDSWQAVSFFTGKFIYGLAVDPKDKCTIYVTDGQYIYKTDDCSRTWKQIYTEQRTNERFVALAVDYGNNKMVYGAELGGDILASDNGGTSWRVIKRFDFELQHLATDPFVPKRIYVAAYNKGLYRTNDAGANWENMTTRFEAFTNSNVFYRLILNPGQKDSLFWISKYGILRSDDAGESWNVIPLITPPGSVNIYGFAVNPKNQKEIYYTGTILGDKDTHIRSTFYKSVDGGKNWVTKKLPTNTIPTAIWVHPEKNNIMFMGFALLN